MKILLLFLIPTALLAQCALVWNPVTGQLDCNSAAAAAAIPFKNNGTSLGSASSLNISTGLVGTFGTGTGTVSADTTVVQTRANEQAGADESCASASASGTTYTCSMSGKALGAYTRYMRVAWVPDVNGTGGATTLAIDGLAAISIKEADGATNPTAADIVAGRQYWIWYDNTNFRLPAAGSGSSLSLTGTIDMKPGGAMNGTANTIWNIGLQNVNCDTLSFVCWISLQTTTAIPIYYQFRWPADFNSGGSVNITLDFTDPSGNAGNIKIDAALSCFGPGTSIASTTLTFNTLSTTGSVALSPNVLQMKESIVGPVTITGCTANNMAVLRLARDESVASNSTDALALAQITLHYTRQ